MLQKWLNTARSRGQDDLKGNDIKLIVGVNDVLTLVLPNRYRDGYGVHINILPTFTGTVVK